jgi:ssDNA-binding Zn-finger/Zn-ribbon topoisomerase 1
MNLRDDRTFNELLIHYRFANCANAPKCAAVIFDYLETRDEPPPVLTESEELKLRRQIVRCPRCGRPGHGKTRCGFARKVREVMGEE